MIPSLLLVASSVAGVLVGRWLLGRWFNHLSIYSVTWGISLFAYELRLILYNPICTVAWLYIAAAWASVFLGAALVAFASPNHGSRHAVMPEFNPYYLKVPILVLSLVTILALISQIRETQAEFGSLTNALFLHPNDVYVSRAEGELGGVPYLGFFGLPAACLAGAYTARVGRVTLIGLLPVLVATAETIISMQRAGVLIAAVLFAYGYIFSPTSHRLAISKRWLLLLGIGAVSLLGFFLLIASHRGSYAYHSGQTQALNDMADYVTGLPSLYFYVSATGPTFSQYLLHPEIDNYSFFGSNTFAPICRLLTKLGFRTYVPQYTPFYYVPQDGNQGTFLAYVHADFGPAGIVLVPALLSAILTFFALRNSRQFRMFRSMLYVNLLVVITYSFSGYYLSLSSWFTSFVVSGLVGWWIDKATERQNRLTVAATI
jgi:oligosaccharide repeat unit polymerase